MDHFTNVFVCQIEDWPEVVNEPQDDRELNTKLQCTADH